MMFICLAKRLNTTKSQCRICRNDYPNAPWALQGYAIQTWQLLDVERVRTFIPQSLISFVSYPEKL